MGARLEGVAGAKRYIRERARIMRKEFLDELNALAMKVVSAIRDGKNPGDTSYWKDASGNLRSSIGYIIMDDGKEAFHGGFERVDGPQRDKTSVDGTKEGMSYAKKLASEYPTGIVLIIVAGMEYAAYVESVKSRTVLAGGRILAKHMLAELSASWNRRFGK